VTQADRPEAWRTATAADELLDPARCAVVVFDLLEAYRPMIEQAGVIAPVQRLLPGARKHGVAVMWARADHRADGRDFARTIADVDNQGRPFGPDNPRPVAPPHGSGSPGYRSLPELGQRGDDYDVPKHRWSAFAGTHLDISLRSAGIDTVVLLGGSTHVGILATAYHARDADYQLVVVRDALTGAQPHRDFLVEHVLPRIGRVRTVDEVLAALARGAD
jgi:nicotinamidase-related amidase